MSDKYAPNLDLMVLMQQETDNLKCQIDHMEDVINRLTALLYEAGIDVDDNGNVCY
jgi:hypothetical protein